MMSSKDRLPSWLSTDAFSSIAARIDLSVYVAGEIWEIG